MRIERTQAEVLRRFVAGRVVHDLGAGAGAGACALCELGASKVVAVDELYRDDPEVRQHIDAVSYVAGRGGWTLVVQAEEFLDLLKRVEVGQETIDVAFVSWPVNRFVPELLALCAAARVVCYLGSCTDGNACGCPELFEHFLSRELLAEVPHRANTLLVLGDRLPAPRAPTGEEYAGLRLNDGGHWFTFANARELAQEGRR